MFSATFTTIQVHVIVIAKTKSQHSCCCSVEQIKNMCDDNHFKINELLLLFLLF